MTLWLEFIDVCKVCFKEPFSFLSIINVGLTRQTRKSSGFVDEGKKSSMILPPQAGYLEIF